MCACKHNIGKKYGKKWDRHSRNGESILIFTVYFICFCLICEFLKYTCCFNNLRANEDKLKNKNEIDMTLILLGHLPKFRTK